MIITIANNNSFKFIHSVVAFMHNEIVSLDGWVIKYNSTN
jgi:hypothetical protein